MCVCASLCVLSGRTDIDWVNKASVVNTRTAAASAASNYRLVGSASSGYFAVAAAAGDGLVPLYRFVLLQVRIVIATLNYVAFVVLQVA